MTTVGVSLEPTSREDERNSIFRHFCVGFSDQMWWDFDVPHNKLSTFLL